MTNRTRKTTAPLGWIPPGLGLVIVDEPLYKIIWTKMYKVWTMVMNTILQSTILKLPMIVSSLPYKDTIVAWYIPTETATHLMTLDVSGASA